MNIIRPTVITDAMLQSSNIPETDYAEWLVGTTYADGNNVIVAAEHKIYESLQNGNVGHTPSTSPTWWLDTGATNRWKIFDAKVQAQSSQATEMNWVLNPGLIDSISLLNLDALSSQIIMADQATNVILNGTAWTAATGVTPPTSWDLVGTPSAFLIDAGALKITSDAAGEGISQTMAVTAGDELQLLGIYKNTAGDFCQIKIEAWNLITNGGMEAGDPPTGWMAYGTPETFERSAVEKYSGSYSAHVVDSTPSFGGFRTISTSLFTVGKTYKFSFRYYIVSGGINAGNDAEWSKNFTTTGSWEFGEFTGVITSPGSYFMVRNISNSIAAEYYIDDVSVSEIILAETDLVSTTVFSTISQVFTVPADCTSVKISLLAKANGDIVWFDTISLSEVVYNETTTLLNTIAVIDWYTYFFEPIVRATDMVKTDLAAIGVPPITTASVTVIVTYAGGTAKCGEVVMGLKFELGAMRWSPTIGIIDYSIKEADAFGNYSITERAYSKRMSCELMIKNTVVDEVIRQLTLYRATPTVYVGSEDYSGLIIYGFYKSFEVVMPYPNFSECNIEIEGLT